MIGKGLRSPTRRVKGTHVGRRGDRHLRRQFAFCRVSRQFLELQGQLFDKRLSLGSLAVGLALQFGDPQLLRRDQRLVLCARHRQFGGGLQTLFVRGGEGHFQRGDIVGKVPHVSAHGRLSAPLCPL
jgi:hypothetical protein